MKPDILHGAIKAYTDAYFCHLGDWNNHPPLRPFLITSVNGKTASGVVDGLVCKIKYNRIYRDANRSPFKKSVLVKLLGEANE